MLCIPSRLHEARSFFYYRTTKALHTRPLTAPMERCTASLRYLKHTPRHGLTYTNSTQLLTVYSDSASAPYPDMRRSTSGFVAFWHNAPISCQSKRQRFVSSSTWEAKYISSIHVSHLTKQLRNLIQEETSTSLPPTSLGIDNKAVQETAMSDVGRKKSRHLDVKYHYFNEQVLRKRILPHHVASGDKSHRQLHQNPQTPTVLSANKTSKPHPYHHAVCGDCFMIRSTRRVPQGAPMLHDNPN